MVGCAGLATVVFFPVGRVTRVAHFCLVRAVFLVRLRAVFRLVFVVKGVATDFVVSCRDCSFTAPVVDGALCVGVNVEFYRAGLPDDPIFVPPFRRCASRIVNDDGVSIARYVLYYNPVVKANVPNIVLRIVDPPGSGVTRELCPKDVNCAAEFVGVWRRAKGGRVANEFDRCRYAPEECANVNGACFLAYAPEYGDHAWYGHFVVFGLFGQLRIRNDVVYGVYFVGDRVGTVYYLGHRQDTCPSRLAGDFFLGWNLMGAGSFR